MSTIADLYENNARQRADLIAAVAGLSSEQLSFRPDEKSWNIKEIVEHVAIVERGITSLIARLLKKSAEENKANDSSANISPEFARNSKSLGDRQTRKLDAPDIVKPSGELSLEDSMAMLDANLIRLNELKSGLETVDTQNHKFPHPFFGDMSATEWLALLGGHEGRHIDQIREVLAQQT